MDTYVVLDYPELDTRQSEKSTHHTQPNLDRLMRRVVATATNKKLTVKKLLEAEKQHGDYDTAVNDFIVKRDATVEERLKPELNNTKNISEDIRNNLISLINRIGQITPDSLPDQENFLQAIQDVNSQNTKDICTDIDTIFKSCLTYCTELKIIKPVNIIDNTEYGKLIDFIYEECATVLPLLCLDANRIVGNKQYKDGYVNELTQFIDSIKNTITFNRDTSQITKFNREKASKQWNATPVKRAEFADLKKLQNTHPGLLAKILSGRSTQRHMLTNDELESAIRYLGYDDKIFVCAFEEKSLANALNKAANNNSPYDPYSFHLIVNNTNDIYIPGNHWTSAKITVNPGNVVIEYADSGKGLSDQDELVRLLSEKFKPKTIIAKKAENVITQLWDYECAYLSLFNCIRDIDGLSQIGGWCNDIKFFSILYYWIQKFALLGLNFAKNDANFNKRQDKDKILRMDEYPSNFEKPLQFEPSFIENKLNPKTVNLPFYTLIQESVKELDEYLNDRENSYAYINGWKKDNYRNRLIQARKFVQALSAAKNETDLNNILKGTFQEPINCGITKYRDALNTDNYSSKLASILTGIEEKIKARENINADEMNSTILFQQALNEFKSQGKHLEVTPSEYSWYGNELISEELNRKTPIKYHTIVDELIGKLHFIKNDVNLSKETRCKDMLLLMNQTRTLINDSLQTPQYETNALNYPPEYDAIWDSTLNTDPVIRIQNLLQDYVDAGGWGLFCSGHWNRHHTSLVTNSLATFRKLGKDLTVEDILAHFARQLDYRTTNPGGSLMKRLHYIAMKTNTPFNLCLRDSETTLNFSEIKQKNTRIDMSYNNYI